MVIHRVFSASSFFFLLHLSLQDLSHNAWEGSSESKQESGVYKKKIPVPFAPGPVPYSKSNEEKEKKFFLSMSLQNQFRFRDPHGSA